jgi:arylsulfatase A-like enzyme
MTTVSDDASEREVRMEVRKATCPSLADVTGYRTLEKVTSWLRDMDERPLFLFLHMWDPHYDYIPPQEYEALFDPNYRGSVDGRNLVTNRAVWAGMAKRDLEHIVALYDGEIRFADDILAKILAELDRSGRRAKPLIIVTADHGEEFFEHGNKGHYKTLFDEVLLVPLVFHWEGHLGPGLVIRQQVQLVDLMPTILKLAGLEPPSFVQGRDLSDLVYNRSLPETSAFCELLIDKRQIRALRTTSYKLVVDGDRDEQLFFDLIHDAQEQRPITRENTLFRGALDKLASKLNTLTAECFELSDSLIGQSQSSPELDADLQQRLRDLGYME